MEISRFDGKATIQKLLTASKTENSIRHCFALYSPMASVVSSFQCTVDNRGLEIFKSSIHLRLFMNAKSKFSNFSVKD